MRGIEIKEVSKDYKDTKALDHVSVQFEDGKIYALLGRNGVCDGTCRDVWAEYEEKSADTFHRV